jgi:hypothetical protein
MTRRILLFSAVLIPAALTMLFASNPAFLSTVSSPPPVITNKVVVAAPVVKLDPNETYNNIIPPVNYTARGHKELGLQYLPVHAAYQCQFYFNHARNNETARSYGLYIADWFAEHGNETDDYIIFTHEFPWRQYNLTVGWKSALTQAHVAECFMKAYERTQDDNYLTLAKKSFMFLKVPVSEGGVLIDEGNSRWWYEEYPLEGGSYVLNGHQFVLIALSKYLDIAPNNQHIRELFDNGLSALKATALQYDNGINDSYYDRLEHPALKYHKTHITNFQRLYDITEDDDWLEIKKVFED